SPLPASRALPPGTLQSQSSMGINQCLLKGIGRSGSVRTAILIALLAFSHQHVWAQVPPDSGQILRETLERDLQPLQPSVDFRPQGQPLIGTPEGGPRIEVTQVRISGNTVYTADELLEAIGEVRGRSFDLAGLRDIANEISTFYRDNGYIFARAVLPPQDLAEGVLVISVVEGRYGAVRATGDKRFTAGAQHFLSPLKPGTVIRSEPLERSMLLLGDQPGITVSPVMRPGTEAGTGDLDISVRRARRFESNLGVDNHGGEFSGEYRGHVGLRINSLARFGDQISLRASYTSEGLTSGQAGYDVPLGGRGLRANLSYARTIYELARPFDDFSGTATITTAGLSYPLVRTSAANLIAGAAFHYKDLENELQGTSFEAKNSDSWPINLQFDRRDGLGGGGVTYGAFSVTPGHLKSDNAAAVQGGYTKANLQLVRLQNLSHGISLFARLSGQWTDSELDSSESFTLGGAADVRAYPQGEAAGDKGVLAQMELRFRFRHVDPYLFYDAGQVEQDALNDRRSLAGAGFGLRHSSARLRLDLAAAWRTDGRDAVTVEKQRDPQLWFRSSYLF
ncbi:MAG: ShlB/FhaC/HecB family hemolysin secretion/activation protein, partial [Aquisalimonadaceae bacterium]